MNKRELALLERAFAAEIDAAGGGALTHLIQPRGKLAEKLVADGLLRANQVTLAGRFPVAIKGYELTELGRMTFCMSCADTDEPTT